MLLLNQKHSSLRQSKTSVRRLRAGYLSLCTKGRIMCRKAWMEGKPGMESPSWCMMFQYISSSVTSLVMSKSFLAWSMYSYQNRFFIKAPPEIQLGPIVGENLPLILHLYSSAKLLIMFQMYSVFSWSSFGRGGPSSLSLLLHSSIFVFIQRKILGKCYLRLSNKTEVSFLTRALVPKLSLLTFLQLGCSLKNFSQSSSDFWTRTLFSMSSWHLFLMATYPSFRWQNLFERMSEASVPRSIMSTLVTQPIVRFPSGSQVRAKSRASLLLRSTLAGITHNIIVLSFFQQYLAMRPFVIASMFFCCPMSTLVMPGRSMRVRSGQSGEKTVSRMGLSTMPLSTPASLSVICQIFCLIQSKLKYLFPFQMSNQPYGFAFGSPNLFNRSSKGVRVTTPEPRGRKSIPTTFYKRELLPPDCMPQTAILGSQMWS